MNNQSKIALIGLGAIGAPLANLLYKKYKERFVLLSSKDFLYTLTEKGLVINNEPFRPGIVSDREQLDVPLGVVFVCVKNYHIENTVKFLKEIVDKETIIIPLQNGVYSYDYFKKHMPDNVILEGFAKGPNTKVCGNVFEYQKPGSFHIGSSFSEYREDAEFVWKLMKEAEIDCFYDNEIKKEIWKKLMLNVAGNAITAITGIDYCMFKQSEEVQTLCVRTMEEFIKVASSQGITLTENDIKDVIDYYLSFNVSKHTSMLEDVLNKRPTENEYIAGYISKLAKKYDIYTPNIDMLYSLVKIKEDVYLGRI